MNLYFSGCPMLCGCWRNWHSVFLDVYIMYDVACNLARHLNANRNGTQLLDRMKFALPSFHAFGHNASCQVC